MPHTPSQSPDLGTAPIGRLLLRLAIPAICAQVVTVLYNLVDRIYIGHIPGIGSDALTGVGICFPILTLITSLSNLFGMGGGARAAIHLGEGRISRAEELMGSCTTALIVAALAASGLFTALMEPLLYAFGGSDATIGYARDYLSIYLLGTVFVLFTVGLNNFITTQGFSTIAMATTMLGAVLNLILDPIFLFVFNLGVRGAALATILSQAVSALWVLRFLTGSKTRLRLRVRYLRPRWKYLAPAVAVGVSPFTMTATESLLSVTFNASLQAYGGDLAVGAMTICVSMMQMVSLPLSGLCQGNQPIVGYNYGAGNMERVKKSFWLLFRCCLAFGAAAWLCVRLFARPLAGLFTDDSVLQDYAAWALQIYLATSFILPLQFTAQQTFVAMGQAKISLFLACLRKLILLIPLILILPHFFSDQVFAVFLAEPVADTLAAVTTFSLFLWKLPKITSHRLAELGEQEAKS